MRMPSALNSGIQGCSGSPEIGVVELAVGGEVAVVEDEGNLVLAGGEMERVFDVSRG